MKKALTALIAATMVFGVATNVAVAEGERFVLISHAPD
ncbi:hypothetical protein MNBD_ALPHA12-1831, partial [hydrothermal vent metagenome]